MTGLKFREGTRVRVLSLNIKGKISYIDYPNLFNHHMSPIQVQLDKPYDSSEQVIYRTDLKGLKAVKKGRKRSKKERRIKVAKLGDLTWIWQSDYNGEEWDYSHIPVVSLYYSQKMRSYILIGAETRTILKTWRKFENGSH